MVTAANQKVNVRGQKPCLAPADELIAMSLCQIHYKKKQNKLNKNRNSSFFSRKEEQTEVYRCLLVSGAKICMGVIEDIRDSDVLPCNLVKSVQFLLLNLSHLSQMQSRCGRCEVTDEGACLRSSKGAKISF